MRSDDTDSELPDETSWDDLVRDPGKYTSPAWHEEVLAERRREVDAGEAKYISLDEFRRRILKEIE